MSNERKPGYYWAKWKNGEELLIECLGGGLFQLIGVDYNYYESSFSWISDQPIPSEEELLSMRDSIKSLKDMLADNVQRMKVMEEELRTTTSRLISLRERINTTPDEEGTNKIK